MEKGTIKETEQRLIKTAERLKKTTPIYGFAAGAGLVVEYNPSTKEFSTRPLRKK